MRKINLTIDVTKIDKSKIKERTYMNKDGVEVTAKDLPLELVELKEKKFIKEGATWIMYKTHFISHPSVKKEDGTYENGTIIGDGISFEVKESGIPPQAREEIPYPKDTIDSSEIPF